MKHGTVFNEKMRVGSKWIVPAVILFGLHLCYAQLQPPFPPEGDSNCGIHPKLIIPDVELRPFLLPGGFYNQRAFCVTIANEVEDQWMVLEASSDLNSWTELVHVLFTKPEFRPPAPTVHNWYYDSQAGTLPRRFYRVRVPGRSVEQARKLWESQKMRSYRFHILYTEWRSGSLPPYGIYSFEGDIIMIDGKKEIHVEDTIGMLGPSINPNDFPSIEGLFDLIDRYTQVPGIAIWVWYDPEFGFPYRCEIDAGVLIQYTISDFSVLPSGSGENSSRQTMEKPTPTPDSIITR